jgi:hypothetical protein
MVSGLSVAMKSARELSLHRRLSFQLIFDSIAVIDQAVKSTSIVIDKQVF